MCDETFALSYSASILYQIDKSRFTLRVSMLDYLYRVSGVCTGGLMGSCIHFNTEGPGFVMTAMFLVIFLEQLLKETKHYTAIIGLFSSEACLYFFGADSFTIPAMIIMLFIFTIFRKPIEKAGGFL